MSPIKTHVLDMLYSHVIAEASSREPHAGFPAPLSGLSACGPTQTWATNELEHSRLYDN